MKHTFVEQSHFLCTHRAIALFAKSYVDCYSIKKNTRWSVVCERKEDLKAVRQQLFFEMNQKDTVVSGISMFTLDTLAQNFCAALASTSHAQLRREIPSHIFCPYIDVNLQEKFIEIILNVFGYTGSDSLSLAKHILTLLDTPLPPDNNLAEVILATQEKEQWGRPMQEISLTAIKQILATIHQAKLELTQYARFQSLTRDYLSRGFSDHLSHDAFKSALVFPKKFLEGHILWIGAPECLNARSGPFQKTLVDEFKNALVTTKHMVSEHTETVFYDSKTHLNTDDSQNQDHVRFLYSENKPDFLKKTEDIFHDKDTCVIKGDFDANQFCTMRMDGEGSYSLSQKDIEDWKTNKKNTFVSELIPHINNVFDQFVSVCSLVQFKKNMQGIAELYEIETKPFNDQTVSELFLLSVQREQVTVGDAHPLSTAPMALSFVATPILPTRIVVIGRPSAGTAFGFHEKMLNNAMALLKQRGVAIDLPAYDLLCKEFWKHLLNSNCPVEFWLENKHELKEFPAYIEPHKNTAPLNAPLPAVPFSHLEKDIFETALIVPDWQKRFHRNENRIAVTQFETYVTCPTQFLLLHIMAIQKKQNVEFEIDPMSLGSRMHQLCEQLTTRLVTLVGNEGYITFLLPLFRQLLAALENEDIFLTSDKEVLKNAVQSEFQHFPMEHKDELILAFFESLDVVYDAPDVEGKAPFVQAQEREILKRGFFKFLQTEIASLEQGQKTRIAVVREFPVLFALENFEFSGKIDRVDATRAGFEIIDYKTSKIPKTEKELVFLPSQAKEKNTCRLSVQGALYSMGWSKFISEQGDETPTGVALFSLYRLKNTDPDDNSILSCAFSPPLYFKDELYQKIEEEYSLYATLLQQGNFMPNPIQGKNTCVLCSYKSVCPVGKKACL